MDKEQIKDSLKNHSQIFSENSTQEKEQIMIDGVDVSGCEFYQIEANELYPKAQYCGSMGNAFCEDNPNCYYKQLARKTQEYKELEKYAQAQENQRETYYKEFLKLSQENEELKRKLSNQEQLYQNEIEIYNQSCLQLRQENDDLYLERLALNTANSGINALLEVKEQECDRYRKALEEIEKYTKKYFCENCEDFNTPEYSSHCEFCEYQEYFDIINKAKGGV